VVARPVARSAKVTGLVTGATPYRDLVRTSGRLARLGNTLRTLRQPRYVALSALMLVVALGCIGAGTWQIVRFEQKVHANDEITANAHSSATPIGTVLPLIGQPGPSEDAVRYRTITATGRYEPQGQGLVRLRSVGGHIGFYVLTPLRTKTATLLVVRGFVAQQPDGNPPTAIAAAPTGRRTTDTYNCCRSNPERRGSPCYRRRICPTRPAARSNRSTSPTSSSGTSSRCSRSQHPSRWSAPIGASATEQNR
jgi:hypothetical protein